MAVPKADLKGGRRRRPDIGSVVSGIVEGGSAVVSGIMASGSDEK